jgi:hypothetical protein
MFFGILLMAVAAFAAARDQHNVMNCPLNVEGTNVAVMDTSTGIEITFATTAGEPAVTELQRRVELAKMHSGDLKLRDMMAGLILPGDVEYESAPDGARLTLTPKDPNRVNAFRAQVREYVEHMKNGKFLMMERMMKMMDERTKGDPFDPTGNERICFNR